MLDNLMGFIFEKEISYDEKQIKYFITARKIFSKYVLFCSS